MRLQKYLAHAGVASRRKCEEYILEGKVKVNGVVVEQLGALVDEAADLVEFNGQKVAFEQKVYIVFNKPPHIMCTSSDPQGRQTVMDYFKELDVRVYPVGRLDYDTEGLIIMTNDGELANALMHPSHTVDKTYYCVCRGELSSEAAMRLRSGVMLEGSMTAPAKVRIVKALPNSTQALVTIHEGRNRQVRRMFEEVGHEVTFLRREQVGNLSLEGISPGKWRYMGELELNKLKKLAKI